MIDNGSVLEAQKRRGTLHEDLGFLEGGSGEWDSSRRGRVDHCMCATCLSGEVGGLSGIRTKSGVKDGGGDLGVV